METRQYLREISVILGDVKAVTPTNALEITGLRMSFDAIKTSVGTPNVCALKIYNLSDNTKKRLSEQFTKMILKVGYDGKKSVIFNGDIINIFHKREGPDIITSLYCRESGQDYVNSFFNKTFSEKISPAAVIREVVTSSFKNVQVGRLDGVPTLPIWLKGKTLSGGTPDVLNKLCESIGVVWSITDGIFNTAPLKILKLNEPIHQVDMTNGLIASPTLTETGINLVMLLRPEVKPQDSIKINSIGATLNLPEYGYYFQKIKPAVGQGMYYITVVRHTGDTHSNTWVTQVNGNLLGETILGSIFDV